MLHTDYFASTEARMSQVAGDRRLAHLAAGYRANPELHRRRQVQSLRGPAMF